MRVYSLFEKTFVRWTVVARAENTPGGQSRWLCRCLCGREKVVTGSVLTRGKSTSCGCLKREANIARSTKHGHATDGISPTYHSWSGMINRCTHPTHKNYNRYGGRGISVCERWMTFSNFLADMGEKPAGTSIERERNSGNYEPGNCVWASPTTQARNRTSNRLLTFAEQTKTIAGWAEELALPYSTLEYRLRAGWSDQEAIETPQGTHSNNRRSRMLTHHGETKTVAQWARDLGIPESRISQRLFRGNTDAEALRQG